MKILVIHNFHRKGSASGDDVVFRNEMALLESHGHEVVRYSAANDEFDRAGLFGKLKITFGMLWSFKHAAAVRKLIREEKPDLVHVHTFFPLLSPSILYAAKKCGCKVVATLHDTRFVCPAATSLCNGKLCNECADGHYFRMRKKRCFKNSGLQSFIVAAIFRYHRKRRSFYDQIDRYVCLNDEQMRLLKLAGFDEGKMVKKYNFVTDPLNQSAAGTSRALPERFAVFYGRIGEEKGIRMLMQIFEEVTDVPLVVMGRGPLEDEFAAFAKERPNVHYLGFVEREECLYIVKQAEFVIFPSIWYEGCSMVEIETESLGKPVIATDLGFSSEAIRHGENGLKVPLGDRDGFIDAIRTLWAKPETAAEMGRKARADYEEKYQPEENYRQLMEIYESTLNGNAR